MRKMTDCTLSQGVMRISTAVMMVLRMTDFSSVIEWGAAKSPVDNGCEGGGEGGHSSSYSMINVLALDSNNLTAIEFTTHDEMLTLSS